MSADLSVLTSTHDDQEVEEFYAHLNKPIETIIKSWDKESKMKARSKTSAKEHFMKEMSDWLSN